MTQKQKADEFIEKVKSGELELFFGPFDFIQMFAKGDDLDDNPDNDDPNNDDPEDDPEPEDDNPDSETGIEYSRGLIDQIMVDNKLDFGQLLKDNPQFKKAYTQRFNNSMSKRLEKFKDVDVDEYFDLKKRADEGNLEGDAKVWKDKYDELLIQNEKHSKQGAIQEVALDYKLDAEQTAFVINLIDLDKLEKDDEGEWMGVEEEIERIQKKFPRMFPELESNGGNGGDDSDSKKSSKYNPGKKKHNHDSNSKDPKERGRQRALERHKQK